MGTRVKLRKVGTSNVITIPKSVKESLDWDTGDELEITFTGARTIVITKKTP